MKLKELREYLTTLSFEYDDCEIILQKDSEGNGYSPLAGIDEDAIYIPDSTWCGEVMSTNWSASDACMTEKEWEDFKESNPRCIVLHPTN